MWNPPSSSSNNAYGAPCAPVTPLHPSSSASSSEGASWEDLYDSGQLDNQLSQLNFGPPKTYSVPPPPINPAQNSMFHYPPPPIPRPNLGAPPPRPGVLSRPQYNPQMVRQMGNYAQPPPRFKPRPQYNNNNFRPQKQFNAPVNSTEPKPYQNQVTNFVVLTNLV